MIKFTENAGYFALLRNKGWLAVQPDDFKEKILERGKILRIPAGQFVYRQGDEKAGIYAILDGGLSVYVAGFDGTPTLITIVRKSTWFGIGPFFSDSERTMSVKAREDSVLLQISLSDIRDLCRDNADATRRIGAIGLYAMEIAVKIATDALIRKTDKRIAAVLLRLAGAEGSFSEAGAALVHVNQYELSEMCNCSRALLNRNLLNFEKLKFINVEYSRIEVLETSRLADYVVRDGG